jgi:6,7-dimethyl-8-ribityllumazine synthase
MSLKIAVVVSAFHKEITQEMLKAAQEQLRDVAETEVFWVPGAFEIPATVKRLAQSGRYDGILPLGCVLRGETAHFEHIARAVTDGADARELRVRYPDRLWGADAVHRGASLGARLQGRGGGQELA